VYLIKNREGGRNRVQKASSSKMTLPGGVGLVAGPHHQIHYGPFEQEINRVQSRPSPRNCVCHVERNPDVNNVHVALPSGRIVEF